MAERIKGSCLCGSIVLEVPDPKTQAPLVTLACHCRDCQKNSGGPCQFIALYKKEDVVINDPSKVYKEYVVPGEQTDSGNPKTKAFCGNCGCTLMTIPAKWKGERVVLRTPLFERQEDFKPKEEWFTKDRRFGSVPVEGAVQHDKARKVD